MAGSYKMPAVAWLKITGYMHAWLEREMGGEVRAHDMRVVSVQHLPGAREILRMETEEDMLEPKKDAKAMSAMRRNMLDAGLKLDAAVTEQMYGINNETLKLYVPIECPPMCLTRNGVLRRWTLYVSFGRQQAKDLQKLLRDEFWQAVEEFDQAYAKKRGEKYPAVAMVTDFCLATKTPELYIEEIRREWQRRQKRKAEQG